MFDIINKIEKFFNSIMTKKEVINIFNLFKRKKAAASTVKEQGVEKTEDHTKTVLEEGKEALKEIEKTLYDIKDHNIFISLLFFVAYYSFIIEFYAENIERIISVKELLLLKYIKMIKAILKHFNEDDALKKQREELLDTIERINEKLYSAIKNIKEQQELDLNVDLKTIQDLIESDF
ncbi:hypothetical protein [Crassaminicella indica]|uniref:Uncharacterized protein n=1 Tax=Crassaminicella indica TaxID=2855394 RepID=A0ABX8RCM2_9CLOT|nr:hypothetical protein [Crassaminicella indica]QXM06807.1 hypothetical protein KVH43_03535 [Crassaminicella indica]